MAKEGIVDYAAHSKPVLPLVTFFSFHIVGFALDRSSDWTFKERCMRSIRNISFTTEYHRLLSNNVHVDPDRPLWAARSQSAGFGGIVMGQFEN